MKCCKINKNVIINTYTAGFSRHVSIRCLKCGNMTNGHHHSYLSAKKEFLQKGCFYICKCGEGLNYSIVNDWYKCPSCGIIYVDVNNDQRDTNE